MIEANEAHCTVHLVQLLDKLSLLVAVAGIQEPDSVKEVFPGLL